jgi:hypothetical protein
MLASVNETNGSPKILIFVWLWAIVLQSTSTASSFNRDMLCSFNVTFFSNPSHTIFGKLAAESQRLDRCVDGENFSELREHLVNLIGCPILPGKDDMTVPVLIGAISQKKGCSYMN